MVAFTGNFASSFGSMELNLPERRVFGPVAHAVLAFACSAAFAATASAQARPQTATGIGVPQQVQSLPDPNDPAAMLSSNLKILAQNPYDVDALLNAGLGAIAVGDPNAAIGFLARAEELSPRNGRVKAALGTALVMVERPVEALRMFADAQNLGIPESQLAKDRGLAWDLRGDQARAQRDYALAAKYKRDDEVTRRHALSLGISGDMAGALRILEPLVRAGDQGAWRARAFILAMNGNLPEAEKIVRTVVPPQMAGSMTSFLGRLATLPAGQRAAAVNFGTMPSGAATAAQPVMADAGEFRPVNGASTAILLPTLPTQVRTAPPPNQIVQESSSDRRKREKREKKLAALAAKNRSTQAPAKVIPPAVTVSPRPSALPAPPTSTPAIAKPIVNPVKVAAATQVTKPEVTPTVPTPNVVEVPDSRVGRRVGEVDPARMPPVVREIVRPEPTAPPSQPKVAIVEGERRLPPPSTSSIGSVLPPTSTLPAPAVSVAAPPVTAQVPVATPSGNAVTNPAPKPVTSAPSTSVSPSSSATVLAPTHTGVLNPDSAPAKIAVASPGTAPANPVSSPSIAPGFSLPSGTPPKENVTVPIDVKTPQTAPTSTPLATTPSVSGRTTPPKLPEPVDLVTKATPVPPTLSNPNPVVSPPASAAVATETALAGRGVEPVVSRPPELVLPNSPLATPSNVTVTVLSPTANVEGASNGSTAVAPAQPISTVIEAETKEVVQPKVVAPEGLGAVLSGIEPEPETSAGQLPSAAEFKARQLAAKRKEEAEVKAKADAITAEKEKQRLTETKEREELEEAKKKEAAAAEAKKSPSRIWVQIATGSNRSGLPVTWRKLKADAPKALESQSAWTAPFRATNRLLIGPFRSSGEARAMINKLGKEGVPATTWTSELGQEVAKIGGK